MIRNETAVKLVSFCPHCWRQQPPLPKLIQFVRVLSYSIFYLCSAFVYSEGLFFYSTVIYYLQRSNWLDGIYKAMHTRGIVET
jgi:hypothetical protein